MKETYTCPRCTERYGDRTEDDSLWFMKNSGYINHGCCPECKTPEEFEVIDKTWKEYTSKDFGANK
jgi:hypothetical protein